MTPPNSSTQRSAATDQAIVLVGLKHCGKSSVARLLAQNLGRPYYDADRLLEEYYAERQNGYKLHTREIYRKLGKESFDQLQINVLRRFFEKQNESSVGPVLGAAVLSLGGGAADLDAVGQILYGENCLAILLEERLELLFERIVQGGLPPFLEEAENPEQAYAMFCKLSEERLRRYRQWATLTIECRQRSQKELAVELQQKLLSL